jgi:flagellar basal-body rod modification protein FlgD
MTTVQTTKTTNATADLLSAVDGAKKEASASQEAQDRFMTLLVTQMKNQDPLNPLDNAQVTSQLAQLSTVTGIDKLNTTLQALQGSYQASQSLQAANLIGRGILMTGSSVTLADNKAVFGLELTEPADKVVVTIRDGAGNAVRTMDLGDQESGIIPLAWDGKADNGSAAANGKYTIDISAVRGSEKVASTALTYGDVLSVTTGAQGVAVNVSGGGTVKLADIRQII